MSTQNTPKLSKKAFRAQNFRRLRRAIRGFAYRAVPDSPESATLAVTIIPVSSGSGAAVPGPEGCDLSRGPGSLYDKVVASGASGVAGAGALRTCVGSTVISARGDNGGRSRRLTRPSHALGRLRRPQHRALGAVGTLWRTPSDAQSGRNVNIRGGSTGPTYSINFSRRPRWPGLRPDPVPALRLGSCVPWAHPCQS